MRAPAVLAFFALLSALPGAAALEYVVVIVPDASVRVDGTSAEVPHSDALPAHVDGKAEVQATEVSLSQTRCSIPTDAKDALGEPTPCTPGAVTSDDPKTIVHYDLEIGLAAPDAAETPASAPQAAPATPDADPAPAAAPVVLAAAAAGASLLGLYGAWRVLKWTGLAAFLPLYSHISDGELLHDANRSAIYRLIQAEPGISTKDVANRLGLAWGTVTHHLGKLEKRRFVVSKKYGKYRRYFANGAGGTDQKDAVAVLRLDRTGDVAQIIQRQPGLTQKAVSQMLGVSSSTILWHVKRLEEVRLVRKVREGKLVRYYPAEGASPLPMAPLTAPVA